MNYIDLFSGIGGFALGAYWAGVRFENHFFSDIEKYPVKLYKQRFPEAIPLGDIRKINTDKLIKKYGQDWVLTGGFPCQDISIAGKGAGIEGKRSGLWFEYWRLIRGLRPRVAIMENVGALTFRGLDTVLGSLAEIGYNAEWQDIRAEDVGAPHRRERVWIIAYPSLERGNCWEAGKLGGLAQCEERLFRRSDTGEISDTYSTGNRTRVDGANRDPAGKKQEREDKPQSEFSRHSETQFPDSEGERRKNGEEGDSVEYSQSKKRVSGRKDSRRVIREEPWVTEPAVGRLANGIPHRVDRLKGLGNAIVPQIAMRLWYLVKPLIEGRK